jgi:hypothetical protein
VTILAVTNSANISNGLAIRQGTSLPDGFEMGLTLQRRSIDPTKDEVEFADVGRLAERTGGQVVQPILREG